LLHEYEDDSELLEFGYELGSDSSFTDEENTEYFMKACLIDNLSISLDSEIFIIKKTILEFI
jgi:hypothetical protein